MRASVACVAFAVVCVGCRAERPVHDNPLPNALSLVRATVSAIPDDFRFHPVLLHDAVVTEQPISQAPDDGVTPIDGETATKIVAFDARVAGTTSHIRIDVVLQFARGQDPNALALPKIGDGPFDLRLVEDAGANIILPPTTPLSEFALADRDGVVFAIGSEDLANVNLDLLDPPLFDLTVKPGAEVDSGVDHDGVAWSERKLHVTRGSTSVDVAPGETKSVAGSKPIRFHNVRGEIDADFQGVFAWAVTR